MSTLLKLRQIFDRGTKIRLLVLLAAIIVGALLEMLALALISPFISVLLDNSIIQTNDYIRAAYDFLGFTSISAFLAFLTFSLATVYIFRGVYLFLLNRVQFRFIARRQAALSERLLSKLLGYSYIYHSKRNIAELQRIVVDDVSRMFNVIVSMLMLLTDFFLMLFIMVFLVIVSPMITFMVMGLALVCVLLYLGVFREQVRVSGEKNRSASIGMIKSVNQALGGIKEVKVLHRESYFQRVFKLSSDIFVSAFTQYRVLDAVPRLVVEAVCFGGAFVLLGFFIIFGADISGFVPQLSLFVLAAFRLLPAVSRQVTYINTILFNRATIDAVHKSLFDEDPTAITEPNLEAENISCPDGAILIHDVSFQYPNTDNPVLTGASFEIPQNKSVAFVGPSGAGKTTLADLILGVLTPNTGGVYYKGKSIHHNFSEWSKNVGYIPQQIYLLDESIRENVAFGIDCESIDEAKVWFALDQAQLKDFVESLPQGLDTVVGDRGVRLSGGQRQRVGIARAMYENPSILVLDEATSSLDNETEKAVMDAVMGFQGNKTILIVAHRLSTIEHCDIVYRVENKAVTREI